MIQASECKKENGVRVGVCVGMCMHCIPERASDGLSRGSRKATLMHEERKHE